MTSSEDSSPSARLTRLANPWLWMLIGLGLTASALVWLRFGGDDETPYRLIVLFTGLLATIVGVWQALRSGRCIHFEFFVTAPRESAVLVALAGLTAVLGCWALYYGRDAVGEWDSLRLFLAVAAALAFLAAPLVLAPRIVQKCVVSFLILFHFGGIASAVIGAPPGPWLMQMIWSRVYWPYLEFMFLTNAYRFYSPEPGPASQLWCRLIYEDKKTGVRHSHWLKLPETDERGEHAYTIALRKQRRQSMVDNVSNAVFSFVPTPVETLRREQQLPDWKWRGVLGQPQAAKSLEIPYHADRRFPEDRVSQYQAPHRQGMHLTQSFARYLARLPHPKHAEYRFKSVKIYRATHRILPPPALAQGADPFDLTLYLPYYQGEFDAQGKLLDPNDPFLFWLVPIMRDDPFDLRSPIKGYVFKHAGDTNDWIRMSAPKFERTPR